MKRWEEIITSTNMTHTIRKVWKTIRKLSNDPTTSNHPCLVSEEEYRKAVAMLNNNKASGRDDVLVQQLKNIGPKAHIWLLTILNKCFMENKIPTRWSPRLSPY